MVTTEPVKSIEQYKYDLYRAKELATRLEEENQYLSARLAEQQARVAELSASGGIRHSISRLLDRIGVDHGDNLRFDLLTDVDRVFVYQQLGPSRKLIYVWNGSLLDMIHRMMRVDEEALDELEGK